MTELTSFTLFPILPTELQELIWTYACYELRCSVVVDNPNLDPYEALPDNEKELAFWTESRRVPPLLHTTPHARRVGLRIYLLLSFTATEIYHNPNADSIRFNDHLDAEFHAIRLLAEKEHVQHIICNTSHWDTEERFDGHQRFFDVLKEYKNLKRVTWFSGKQRLPEKLVEEIKEKFEKASKTSIGWRVPKLTFSVLSGTGDIDLSPFEQDDEEQMTKDEEQKTSTTRRGTEVIV